MLRMTNIFLIKPKTGIYSLNLTIIYKLSRLCRSCWCDCVAIWPMMPSWLCSGSLVRILAAVDRHSMGSFNFSFSLSLSITPAAYSFRAIIIRGAWSSYSIIPRVKKLRRQYFGVLIFNILSWKAYSFCV